jgi:hypothetical protein
VFWTRRLIAPLALAAGVALMTGAVLAQPKQPDKGDKKKGDKKDFKKGPFGEKKGPPPKADPTVEAWLRVVLEKITDPHDVVRDSARDAVISVGPQAIPALEKLAEGKDDAKAEAARRLIHAIHFHHGHPMHDAHGPGHDGGGGPHHGGFGMHMGPHHFGHPGMGGFGRGGWGHGFGPMGHGPMGKGPKEKGPKDKGGKEKGGEKGERKRDEREGRNVAPMPHVASR